MENVDNPDFDQLSQEKDPLGAIRRIQENAVKQHEDDREVYMKEKNGETLSKEEHERVVRYRTMRTRLRKARRGGGGVSLMAKLDMMVYFLFAVGLYFILLWEYKLDVLPMILNFLRPNFDHLDEGGNWKTHAEEL